MTYQERGIGDNSRHYAEEIAEQVAAVLPDDHETDFRYAQWHVGDYITGTMGMQLEAEGAYIRFLMRLYQRGKPLPDNDRFMSDCMCLSIRVWRRIKDLLVQMGKIIVRSGGLTNARFEKEREKRAEMRRKQAQAAHERHARERREKQAKQETSAKLRESFPQTSPKLQQNSGKKTNETNGPGVTNHPITYNQEPLTNKVNGSLVDIYIPPDPKPPVPLAPPPELRFEPRVEGDLTFEPESVSGPGFVLDLKACALEVQMCLMPVDLTPALVEIIARDWAANGVRPRNTSTWFRNALVSRKNQTAIERVRLETGIKRAAQSPQSAQIDAAYERMIAKKKARGEA
jgi:uncharacterized protein YdaU (DUF1376 family)